MPQTCTILQNINDSRELLVLKIKEIRDRKGNAILEKKLTAAFVFLGETLKNCTTEAELRTRILEKIRENDGTSNYFCDLLLKSYDPRFAKMISELTSENVWLNSLLLPVEEQGEDSDSADNCGE